MIDAARLLHDLRRLRRTLESDLREAHAGSEASGGLRTEWQAARDAGRTGGTFESFLDDALTQSAVHWILAGVFLRFLEDNGLVERPWLAGPGDRMHLARDRYEAYFRAHPHESDRDYLLACFREAAALPGLRGLFDERHNPLFRLPLSGDGGMALLGFFRKLDPDSGHLVHDFTDPGCDTRFLGDLYQDLSDDARERYALLQTPEFVEEFILERTLEPAIREFGFREVRLIDPACGSGHFLLDAFRRLFDLWCRNEPARNVRDSAQRALDAVAGVDVNPFAAEIARFRLLLAALHASGIARLAGAPDFRLSVATGDSLLHGRRFLETRGWQMSFTPAESLRHVYHAEDRELLDRLLGRQYHAVVGNPPYVTVKDAALNNLYRERYDTCHRTYPLAVPFIERFFDLALDGNGTPAGFVGTIVANSFMKRQFGKKLVEDFLPRLDVTYVVDTSGVQISGHGTRTVILFGRNRSPVGKTIRTVMGTKNDPEAPTDPARGVVWLAICEQIDQPGSQSEFISVEDVDRNTFATHPWSIGGGELISLHRALETYSAYMLGDGAKILGGTGRTSADELMVSCSGTLKRKSIPERFIKPLVEGHMVRDWLVNAEREILLPYENGNIVEICLCQPLYEWLWPCRTHLSNRAAFGYKTYFEEGRAWWSWHQITWSRITLSRVIAFGEVATHNHFALDFGGRIFKQTAPFIALPAGAADRDYLVLLGLLNSSTACFWLKQVCSPKGASGIGRGIQDEAWESWYAHDAAKLKSFPVVEDCPVELVSELEQLARELTEMLPPAALAREVPTRAGLDAARKQALTIRRRMIALQEELDWRCYRLYGVIDEELKHPDPPAIELGERAFEIVMARRMADGELQTAWFERHGSTPTTAIPDRWPEDYRALVERRIALIEEHRWVGLVERPEYKRRWQWQPWEEQEQEALRSWLLDRLEDPRFWPGEPALVSTNRLTERARQDPEFRPVAELYAGRVDIELERLVAELVEAEAVPFLPVLRYTDSGLRKRQQWEATWELQRREDAIDARAALPEGHPERLTPEQAKALRAREVGDIPVPPKYRSADFQRPAYWRLRGGLDVPKERFVSYPFCERDADGSPVVSWAGYDHLQQASAIAAYYVERRDREGWEPERLLPLLAGLRELLPWLRQWHNEYDPATGVRMGDYFAEFVRAEAHALGFSEDALAAWAPPARTSNRRRGRARREAAE